jgi:hypothetical protein
MRNEGDVCVCRLSQILPYPNSLGYGIIAAIVELPERATAPADVIGHQSPSHNKVTSIYCLSSHSSLIQFCSKIEFSLDSQFQRTNKFRRSGGSSRSGSQLTSSEIPYRTTQDRVLIGFVPPSLQTLNLNRNIKWGRIAVNLLFLPTTCLNAPRP